MNIKRKRDMEIRGVTMVMLLLSQKGMKVMRLCVFQRCQSNQNGFLIQDAHFNVS